jgi:hypothetical protein
VTWATEPWSQEASDPVRAHYTETIIWKYGPLVNARVRLFVRGTYNAAADTGTVPAGLFDAETGGNAVGNTFFTNDQGEAECWSTTPQDFDRVVDDNGGSAHYVGDTLSRAGFAPFMDERSAQLTIDPASLPASGFDPTTDITFTGSDKFTKRLRIAKQIATPAAPTGTDLDVLEDTDGALKVQDANATKHYLLVGPTKGDLRSYIYGSDTVGDNLNAFNRALGAVSQVYVPKGLWKVSNEVVVGQHQSLFSDAPNWDDSPDTPAQGAIIQAMTLGQRSTVRVGAGAGQTVNGFLFGIVVDGHQLATNAGEFGNSDGSAADASKAMMCKFMNGVAITFKCVANFARLDAISVRCNKNVANPGDGFYQSGSDMVCVDMNTYAGNRNHILGDEGIYIGGHWTGNSGVNSTENTLFDTIDRCLFNGIVFDTAGPSAVGHIHVLNAIRNRWTNCEISNQYTLANAAFPAILLESTGGNCSNNKFGIDVCVNGTAHAGYTYGWSTLGTASKFFGNNLGPGNFGSIVGPAGIPGGPSTSIFNPASVMPRIVRPLTQVLDTGAIVEVGQMFDLVDAVTIAADFRAAEAFHLTNWVTGHTLGAASSITPGLEYKLLLENTTGGGLTLNFNAMYHLLTGTSVTVAGGKHRVLTFLANSAGTILYAISDSGDLA